MNIQEMHYEFKVRVNRIDTQHYQDLPPHNIDNLLNNAINHFVEHYAYANKLPFEVTQSRIDMLSNLVIGQPEQPVLTPTRVSANSFEVKFSDLVYPYAHLVRAAVNSNCGVVNIKLIPMEFLNRMLNDAMQRPSYRWRRLLGTIRKTSNAENASMYIYTEPAFELNNVMLEYIKQPKKVFFGGYNTVEYDACIARGLGGCDILYNVNTPPVDCDIADMYHSLIVDIAVREFGRYTENAGKFQLQDNKISIT
jgi:hypothetical protein